MYLSQSENLSISGSVERVTFHNLENGYCVLRVNTERYNKPITITANLPSITAGENIECYGEWITHQKFGEQFKASRVLIKSPTDIGAIEKFLASGIIKGIGESYAKKLVHTFGDKTLEALEKAAVGTSDSIPVKLMQQALEVKGKTWEHIKEGIFEYIETHKKYEQERLWLTGLGLGPMSIQKLIKEYGEKTIHIIKNNPYVLIERVKGFGFLKSDDIALKLGIPVDSPFRIKAGLLHIVKESNTEGNCYIEIRELLSKTAELLELDEAICFKQLQELVTDDELRHLKIDNVSVVGLSKFDDYEQAIGSKIKQLCSTESAVLAYEVISGVVQRFEEKTQWTLNEQQNTAIATALTKRCLIVTGGPGTGKTTITRCISMALANIADHKLIGCSPTGRAAKRLSESLNADGDMTKIECSSIHRLLEARVSPNGKHYFNRTANNPIEVDTLIVDEMSMVDVSLFYHLLKALPSHVRLILIGDVDQLPSVGAGRVLFDLIECEIIPVVRLVEVQRQAAASKIISNAHRINEGLMPIIEQDENEPCDFLFIKEEEPEVIKQKLIELVCHVIPQLKKGDDRPYNSLLEVQVLSPMKNSVIGVNALNGALQRGLNPKGIESENKIKRGEYWFCEGDKVIQLQNNYDKFVYNGDIGFIQSIDKEQGLIEVLFAGTELVTVLYKTHELDQLSLAYATTIHKSQGSEYPIVVMPISTQHYIMLQRNLLYTGVTRGKKLVFIIGKREALEIAVNNNKTAKRLTHLKERLIS